ncbi:MAG: histidine--tRNA ligase [Proteobacteria bacterium]|nr:histidine--tRNA ligase [Pseudomonadota bacterium]MCP4918412.1 histidine--tRNA ligase [Pseudomonadota bacterium]
MSKKALSGFPEWLPADELVQQDLLTILRREFSLHGYVPLHTRAVEPLSALLSKGGDTDKEIYVLKRLSDAPEKAAELGLHFDLTVPFARYVAANRGQLTFPFRRYQIQPAWRGERPQLGRYREFLQADIDIIGSEKLDVRYDGEIVRLLAHTMGALPVPRTKLMINNRKVLEGLYRGLGIEDITGTLRIVDKLDKIGPEKVATLLVEAGRSAEVADRCLAIAEISSTVGGELESQVRALGIEHELLDVGLGELSSVLDQCADVSSADVVADLRIARGLDYYTGTVVEGVFVGHDLSTVCSGGRYDNLAGGGKARLPGVGASIGVTRIMGYCLNLGLFDALPGYGRASTADVMVAVHGEDSRTDSEAVARQLRARGVSTVVCHTSKGYGKQIGWADKAGIPYVWMPARGDNGHTVKDIRSGEQVPASPEDWSPV